MRERQSADQSALEQITGRVHGRAVERIVQQSNSHDAAKEGDLVRRQVGGGVHSIAEAHTAPDTMRVELEPNSGALIAFSDADDCPDSLQFDGTSYSRVQAAS